MKKNWITAAFGLCLFSSVIAQDTQYWTQQFGTRSALLGGAVVASADDNTALYYNPGILGFIDTGSLSINANIYGIENIRISNAVGQSIDFKSSQVSAVPLLIGGMLRNKGRAWRLSYGILAPVDFNFKATARIDKSYAIVDNAESPGDELFIGQADINTQVKEVMGGFGGGRKINSYWSVGIAGFFGAHSQVYSRNSLARFYMNPTSKLVSSTIIQNFSYYNVRFFPKVGVNWQKDRWKAGMVLTSPSFSLFGTGSIAIDATATNIKPLNSTERIDVVANDRQEKLKTNYKSPLSVSGGLSYAWRRSQINISGAYFASIDQYEIIQAKAAAFARPPDAYPELTSDEFLRIKTAAKPVFNFAIGYEYAINDHIDLDLSYRSNQTYYDTSLRNERGIKPDFSSWNINHTTAGVNIRKNRSQLSMGFLFSFGADKDRAQGGNLENPSEENILQGKTVITEAKYSAFAILLGFTFNFQRF